MPLYDLERSSSLEVLGKVMKKISAIETVYSLGGKESCRTDETLEPEAEVRLSWDKFGPVCLRQ